MSDGEIDNNFGDAEHLPPLLARMKPYSEAAREAERIHDWVGEIEQDIRTLQWIAAGGRGMACRESVIEKIDAQIRNLEALQEQIEDLEDSRELGEEARLVHTETDQEDNE